MNRYSFYKYYLHTTLKIPILTSTGGVTAAEYSDHPHVLRQLTRKQYCSPVSRGPITEATSSPRNHPRVRSVGREDFADRCRLKCKSGVSSHTIK